MEEVFVACESLRVQGEPVRELTADQFGLKGQFLFNSTLQGRKSEYAQVNQNIQVFRNMTPGSGAYFVRVLCSIRVALTSVAFRMRVTSTSLTMNIHIGATTTADSWK